MVVFLVSVAGSVDVHFIKASAPCDNGMATGSVPNSVQMDRDLADVPRAQVSSPILTTPSRIEIAPVPVERLVASIVTFESASAIIKQQHVFRI
jgi:hypothetical protein